MPDWRALFVPEHSLVEIALRGTIMYLALFVILRFVMQRQAGAVGLADLLVIVLIADVSQNAFSNEYKSLTEGVLLVLTIVGWNYGIDWLGYRFPAFERFITPRRLPLVVDGEICWRNMRREMITHAELMSQLRQQGIEDPAMVRIASIEGDGRISVIRRDDDDTGRDGDKRREVA
ncbi:DUF421 domain-containing protein [Methylobacterium nodulans]|uniref:YetF C-terminal domain-containing protein n=1 Tax=Methylobacterium nodulans (strain LMG 21967 / CNCM I-2342 / ORS 2060) TaxID=460265 RepID=B8ICH6_METNO|nr:YetF domain-containing protein [Methylobacterium nodulans]ACL55564.1 protein of unknown function DUF421 [Methylobacterium nodulans ORS 2060]